MTPTHSVPTARVLSIAGTDPTGGAGQAADLKSIAAMGGYGMSVITAVVAQNTRGVTLVHTPPTQVLTAQLEAVSSDVRVDAVKIGMLGSVEVIRTVRQWLSRHRPPVVVIDPVMVATAGGRLLEPDAEDELRSLLPLADLITPNLAELAVLASAPVAGTWEEALDQGREVAAAHGTRVLVKGGHLPGDRAPDALLEPGATEPLLVLDQHRVHTRNTHGTGCSLSSALATRMALTGDWADALRCSRAWLHGALEHADELEVGHGNGPIHHFHHVQDRLRDEQSEHSFTEQLWDQCAPVRQRIDELAFIQRLADGSLPSAVFEWYMDQDHRYLTTYSRVLAALASKAHDDADREFFARGAADTVAVESALHRARLGDAAPQPATEVTATYTDFLHATVLSEEFAVGAAAVLPCYWLYAQIGADLTRRGSQQDLSCHPYADWLRTYDDPGFQQATVRAREIVDRAARGADRGTRARMQRAFHRACELELRFFDAPLRHAVRPASGATS